MTQFFNQQSKIDVLIIKAEQFPYKELEPN